MSLSHPGNIKHEDIDLDVASFQLVRLIKGCDPSIPCDVFPGLSAQGEVVEPYEAISYKSKDPAQECVILVNGAPFGVTKSLHEALRSLQLEEKDRVVWVDQVCVDQTNKMARAWQARHIADICKGASRVIFWLGYQPYMAGICLRRLHMLQQETEKVAVLPAILTQGQWATIWQNLDIENRRTSMEEDGMRQLLASSWFKDVWTPLHVACSREAVVQCGMRSISAHIFKLAPHIMGLDLVRDVGPRCQAILDIMPGPVGGSPWFDTSPDLYTAIEKFRGGEARDPRDTVYALLGLSCDAIDAIEPDYQKREKQIVSEVFYFLFHVHPDVRPGARPHSARHDARLRGRTSPHSLRDLFQHLKLFNELALETAAMEDDYGSTDMKTAMKFNLTRRPDLAISLDASHGAGNNKGKGLMITLDILDHLDKHRPQSWTMEHSSSLVQGAAANPKLGDQILDLFFGRATRKPSVTDTELLIAAENPGKGPKIMKILLKHRQKHAIHSDVMDAVVENQSGGYEIFKRIYNFMHSSKPLVQNVTEEFVRSAAKRGQDKGGWALGVLRDKYHADSYDEIFKWIVESVNKDGKKSLIRRSVEEGNLTFFTHLLHWIEIPGDVKSSRALVPASSMQDIRFVEMLLQWGADVNITDDPLDGGATPLGTAVMHDRGRIFYLLVEKGANIHVANRRGETPLHLAARFGRRTFVRALLDFGADPNVKDGRGTTPLMWASTNNDRGIGQDLLDYRADRDHWWREPSVSRPQGA